MPILKHEPLAKFVTTRGVPQLSVAVGATHCATAQVSEVAKTMFAGQGVKRGLRVSKVHGLTTVTVNEQNATLPFASVAV